MPANGGSTAGISSGYSAILLLARLGRVARVLMATKGLRKFPQRLGRVALVAAGVVLLCSLSAYEAEHATNPGFATFGDAIWWGIVTLTTVGYGDIVPKTTAGRVSGVAIMFTGVAELGVLAGSLASMFGIDSERDDTAAVRADRSVEDELASLQAQLGTMQRGLTDLGEHIGSLSSAAAVADGADPGPR